MQPGDLEFVERFALLLNDGGMPRMPARIYACVMADDEGRLTASELAERLGISAAAVSGAVRYCVQSGLLVRGRDPGARRDHYHLGDDIWYEVFARREHLLAAWRETMRDGADTLGDERPAGRRLRESERFFAFLQVELPALIDRWHTQR